MDTVKQEIQLAIDRIGLKPNAFRELSDQDAEPIFKLALDHFVGSVDRRWWWEGFIGESVSRKAEQGFTRLVEIVPDPNAHVWFIVEENQLPFYPVYEATPIAAQRVIGECYGFEYYLVAKDMTWLLCENHHDWLIGIGEPICGRLSSLFPQS